MRWLVLCLTGWLGLAMVTASAARAEDYPSPSGAVVDGGHVLTVSTRKALEAELDQDNRSTTAQLAVATVPTTGGVSIETYAMNLFNRWGIGDRGADDGVLLVVAVKDHRLRIQTGRGLAQRLSDADAQQIIDQHIVPRFKANDFNGGVVAGIEAVRRHLDLPAGLATPAPPSEHGDNNTLAFAFVGVLAVITGGVLFFSRRLGSREPGWFGTAHGTGTTGSTGGFGGGSTGGGGASGGW